MLRVHIHLVPVTRCILVVLNCRFEEQVRTVVGYRLREAYIYRTVVGFESISRALDIDTKYGQYYTAVGYRFR